MRDEHARGGAARPAAKTMGFFTDTTLCIGCKACEVACKEWNQLPDDGFGFTGMSYDNTGHLGASTWRHVAFVERPAALPGQGSPRADEGRTGRDGVVLGQPHPLNVPTEMLEESKVDLPLIPLRAPGQPEEAALERAGAMGGPEPLPAPPSSKFAWLMLSDVCKHCERAGCLEACPTGAIVRTEFGSVYVQPDVCNGCGYCVSACPFGVVDRREDDGRAWKCTLCYDRLRGGLVPACAKACPTASIQFGEIEALREKAAQRVETLHQRGVGEAYLYGESAAAQPGTEGLHAFFLLCDRPEAYNLPPDPVVPTKKIADAWWAMAASVVALAGLALWAAVGARRTA